MENLSRTQWDEDGYAAVRGAIPLELRRQFETELAQLWESGSDCKILSEGAGITTLSEARALDLSHHHYRILDIQNYLPSVQAMAGQENITQAFLNVFGRRP